MNLIGGYDKGHGVNRQIHSIFWNVFSDVLTTYVDVWAQHYSKIALSSGRHFELPLLVCNNYADTFFFFFWTIFIMFSLAQKWLWELVRKDQVTGRATGLSRWRHFSPKCRGDWWCPFATTPADVRVELTPTQEKLISKSLELQIPTVIFSRWMPPYRVALKINWNFEIQTINIWKLQEGQTAKVLSLGRENSTFSLHWHLSTSYLVFPHHAFGAMLYGCQLPPRL